MLACTVNMRATFENFMYRVAAGRMAVSLEMLSKLINFLKTMNLSRFFSNFSENLPAAVYAKLVFAGFCALLTKRSYLHFVLCQSDLRGEFYSTSPREVSIKLVGSCLGGYLTLFWGIVWGK